MLYISIKEAMNILHDAGVHMSPAGLRYNGWKYGFIKKARDLHHDLYNKEKMFDWLQNRQVI